MHAVNKLQNYKIARFRNSCRGYILITFMLFFSLLAIAALAVLPDIVHEIQRDREEEMLNRGTQYRRAVQKYYKKFGRYPARVEELENTNQQRFLRKRYQDPLTKKDFKIVRLGDPALNSLGFGAGFGQGVNPGLAQAMAQGGKLGAGGLAGGQAAQAIANITQGLQPASPATPNPAASVDAENPDAQVDAKSAASSTDSGPAPGGQVFGGGPILGVASTSKAKTIREYNRKNHYNEWLFIYDPSADRGGLLKGPVQPDLAKSVGIQPAPSTTQPAPNAGPTPGPQPGPQPGQEPPEQ